MYRLLIADDEAIERQAMRHMLSRGLENAEIVGEAANGKEAVHLADTLHPDMILMDIKMPGLDGVEAVKAIKKAQPAMKFIMVSAFDTFEYAREVMHQGVKEYLLKPSKKDEILATVRRVIEEIRSEKEKEEERQALEGKLDQALSFVRSEWVTTLLLDHVQETETAGWRDFLELDDGGIFAVVCRLTGSRPEEKKRGYAFLKKTLWKQPNCLVGPMAGGLVPMLAVARDEKQTARSQAVKWARKILQTLDSMGQDIDARIGIGTAVNTVKDFVYSYEEALAALEETNEHVRCLSYHPSFARETDSDMYRVEKKLLEAVKDGDEEGTLSSFEQYARELNGDRPMPKKPYEHLSFMIAKITEEMGISLQMPLYFSENDEPGQRREMVKLQLLHTAREIRRWHSDRTLGLLQEARHYIDEHYRESLTLEEVAEQIKLSPYYFSKLFKERNGATFIEYLTEVRIRRAKELLRMTRLSLKEICFEAGYRDPNYFSRVFKKNTGRSPSEYRASVTGPATGGS
ncbi:MAG TPA: response regulator [Bacillales bacterium]|nr:response regulator [Bacillales bacterium]